MLSVYPLLATFVAMSVLPSGYVREQCVAFLALCDLIDILLVANLGKCTGDEIRNAVIEFLRACVNAGWREYFIPKFHWLTHLADHFERFGMLPSCWTHERKHRITKRYAADIHNTTAMERSVLGKLCSHNLADLSLQGLFDLSPGIVQSRVADKAFTNFVATNLSITLKNGDVVVGSKMRIIPAGFCCRGDVVLIKSSDCINFTAGEINAIFEVHGRPMLWVRMWEPASYDRNNGFATWKHCDNHMLIPGMDILCAVMHLPIESGSRTLVPWLYRRHMPVMA